MNATIRRIALLAAVGLRYRSRIATLGLVVIVMLGATGLVAGRSLQLGGSAALDATAAHANRADIVLWGRASTLRSIADSADLSAGASVPPASLEGRADRSVGGVAFPLGATPLEVTSRYANRGDLVAWGRSSLFPAGTEGTRIIAAGGVRRIASAEFVASDGVSELLLVSELPLPGDLVGKLVLRSGVIPPDQSTAAPKHEAVVVEPGMAKVGDTVRIKRLGHLTEATVVGVAVDFSGCGYPTCRPGHVFVQPSVYTRIVYGNAPVPADEDATMNFSVRGDSASAWATAAQLHLTRPGIYWHMAWSGIRAQLLAPDQYLGSFVSGLGIFLLLAALLTVAGTLSAQMASRRRDLAIFSSLGARPSELATAIVVEHVALGLCGAALGWVGGSVVAPLTRATVARAIGWGGPQFRASDFVLVCAVTCVLIAVTALGSAVRSARRPVVEGLRNDVSAGHPRVRWTFQMPSIPLALGVGDPFTRPMKSLFALLGLMVASAGALCAFGLRETVGSVVSSSTRAGERWDVTAWSMDNRSNDELVPIVRPLRGVKAVYTRRSDPATLAGSAISRKSANSGEAASAIGAIGAIAAIGQGGDANAEAVHIVEGRQALRPGEATASTPLLLAEHHAVGDDVTFDVRGKTLRVRIVGSYQPTIGDRLSIRYRFEQLKTLDPTAPAGSVQILADGSRTRREILHDVQAATGNRAQSFAAKGIKAESDAVRLVLLMIGALIVLAALGQLGGAWLVGAREQSKDVALLASIGMTPRQLRWRSGIGAGLVATVAWTAATPLGLVALHLIGRSAIARAGVESSVLRYAGARTLTLGGIGVVALAALLGSLSAHTVTGVPVAERLRRE